MYLDLQYAQNNGPHTAYASCFGILDLILGTFGGPGRFWAVLSLRFMAAP